MNTPGLDEEGPFLVRVGAVNSETRHWISLAAYRDFPSFRGEMCLLFHTEPRNIFIDGIDHDFGWSAVYDGLGLTDIAPPILCQCDDIVPKSNGILDCIHEINSFCQWNLLDQSDKEVFDAYCCLKVEGDEDCPYLGDFNLVWKECLKAYVGDFSDTEDYVQALTRKTIDENNWIWDYIDFGRMAEHWDKNYLTSVTTGNKRRIVFDIRRL